MQESDIIQRIQALCQARSWTYYRLAKESGLTYSTLCTMMHKANAPSLPTLMKICKGFGITPAEFFDADNPVTSLSPADAKHLQLWMQLNDANKEAATKFIGYLLFQQQKPPT